MHDLDTSRIEKTKLQYICGDCAAKQGAIWKGYPAEWIWERCPYCFRAKPLTDTRNFIWNPKTKKPMNDKIETAGKNLHWLAKIAIVSLIAIGMLSIVLMIWPLVMLFEKP